MGFWFCLRYPFPVGLKPKAVCDAKETGREVGGRPRTSEKIRFSQARLRLFSPCNMRKGTTYGKVQLIAATLCTKMLQLWVNVVHAGNWDCGWMSEQWCNLVHLRIFQGQAEIWIPLGMSFHSITSLMAYYKYLNDLLSQPHKPSVSIVHWSWLVGAGLLKFPSSWCWNVSGRSHI